MAHYFHLQGRMDEVATEYFDMMQKASDRLPLEVQSVIKIQSTYRSSKVQKAFQAVIDGALRVQRVARGWLARTRMKAMMTDRTLRLNAVFFHHCAAVVQKFFRGWKSRRSMHDFYGRRGYLAKVAKRGEYTTQYLQREHQRKLADAKAQEEAQMRHEFDNLAGELHHLVSTKTIAGVYNPPYSDALPRAFEKPIEQHLRDSCRAKVPRSLSRPRHRAALADASPCGGVTLGSTHAELQAAAGAAFPAGPPQDLPDRRPHQSRTASAGRMQKIQGPFRSREQIEVSNAKARVQYGSVQNSAPYHALEHDRKLQGRLAKLTRVSPMDFVAPGLPPEKLPASSVHASVPFRERPFELRSDYVELPKIRDKPPFFTALPSNKHFGDYGEHDLIPSGHV